MRGRTFFIARANTPVLLPNHEFAKEDILDFLLSLWHHIRDGPLIPGKSTSPGKFVPLETQGSVPRSHARALRTSFLQILFVIFASPIHSWWGSNSESLSQQSKVLPLGHGICWRRVEVTDVYSVDMAEFAQIFGATWVQRTPGARKFSSAQLFPTEPDVCRDPTFSL